MHMRSVKETDKLHLGWFLLLGIVLAVALVSVANADNTMPQEMIPDTALKSGELVIDNSALRPSRFEGLLEVSRFMWFPWMISVVCWMDDQWGICG